MKKFLLLAGAVFLANVNGQVFQENWDGDGPGVVAWTFIDNDGNTPAEPVADFITAWVIKDINEFNNYWGHTNSFVAASTSAYNPPGQSDDWMISPEITIPETGEYAVKWDAKSAKTNNWDHNNNNGSRNDYKIMISPTAGTTIADFTETLATITEELWYEWKTRASSLTDYAGQTIRLAWVNNSINKTVLLVDNISVVEAIAPDCPSLVLPADGAAEVDYSEVSDEEYYFSEVSFAWEAPTTGGVVDKYELWIGTSIDNMWRGGITSETSISLYNYIEASTTYYWKVVAVNPFGTSQDCATYSFTTPPSPLEPYCYCECIGPDGVHPITYVGFAGINNSSLADSVIGHENFIDQVGTVEQGETYQITLKGNANWNGWNSPIRFAVFIDWDQDGTFSADETYEIMQTIENSTGLDDIEAVQDIMVPVDAMLGETRMRVKSNGISDDGLLDPCWSYYDYVNSQVEDYTISVSTLGTNDLTLSKFSVYPNPASKKLNIKGTDVKNVKVYNVLGQQMKVLRSNNSVNVESLAPGTYVLQVEDMSGKVNTTKFIKK